MALSGMSHGWVSDDVGRIYNYGDNRRAFGGVPMEAMLPQVLRARSHSRRG